MAQYKSRERLKVEINAGPNPFLIDEICRWCDHYGFHPIHHFINKGDMDGVPWETMWNKPKIIKSVLDRWELIQEKSGEGDAKAKRQTILELFDQHFIQSAVNGFTLYRFVDATNKVVEPLVEKNLLAQIGQQLKHKFMTWEKTVTKSGVQGMLETFQIYGNMQEEPIIWAQPDEDAYCIAKATVRPDATVDYPHIKGFLARLNDPEAFSAWIWGVYSNSFARNARQCLYLSDIRGKSGNSGKSSFFQSLGRLFGKKIYSGLNGKLMTDNAFSAALFVGKKLVVVGDCKDPNILMRQPIKELSGDDDSVINEKFQPMRSAQLECKLCVSSNYLPNITSEEHNQSRTLWIKIVPLRGAKDPNWPDSYDDEMPGFLAYAKQCYAERCPDDNVVQVNAVVKQEVALRILEVEARNVQTFAQYFVVDPKGTLPQKDFSQVMELAKFNAYEAQHFLAWIGSTFFPFEGLRGDCDLAQGVFYHGLRLKSGRDRNDTSIHSAGDRDTGDDDQPFRPKYDA